MSLKSWIEEFYPPMPPICESDVEQVTHSLNKWKGALPENLKKHGVVYRNRHVIDDVNGDEFEFGCKTCSLCVSFCRCTNCPIVKVHDRNCDEPSYIDDLRDSEWMLATTDPIPMVKLLQSTLDAIT